MEPLTPNTAALLDYLSATMSAQQAGNVNGNMNGKVNVNGINPQLTSLPSKGGLNLGGMGVGGMNNGMNGLNGLNGIPNSLPPSAFFNIPNMPVPGRDTPEHTPESSLGTEGSPERERAKEEIIEDESGSGSNRRKSTGDGAVNKRKAGHGHTVQQESEEDDSDSDEPDGHEGKRPHPNDKLEPLGRKSGRKSEGSKPSKENKAARRKEQNRAAQKAFRERREAKVKDLEDKISELEAKSTGMGAENENLRSILKRLQEENVRLKQTAFTFQMPGTSTPNQQSQAQTALPSQTPSKASSPHADDTLRSINDPPRPSSSMATRTRDTNSQTRSVESVKPTVERAASSSSSLPIESPQSLLSSIPSSTPSNPPTHPSFDPAETFNAFATGTRPEWFQSQSKTGQQTSPAGQGQGQVSRQASTPSTTSQISPLSGQGADMDALWASFYPGGINAPTTTTLGNVTNNKINNNPTGPQFATFGQSADHPTNVFTNSANTGMISDKMAFRDNSAAGTVPAPSYGQQSLSQQGQNTLQNQNQPEPAFDWSNFNDSSINEFLASLSGTNNVDNSFEQKELSAEDEFTTQLQKLLDQNAFDGGQVLGTDNLFYGANDSFGMGMGNGNGLSNDLGVGMGTDINGYPSSWSPSNYLNLSPFASSASASASISTSSPASQARESSVSVSNSNPNSNAASPESSASVSGGYQSFVHNGQAQVQGMGMGQGQGQTQVYTQKSSPGERPTTTVHVPKGAGATALNDISDAAKKGHIVHVVGEDGKVLKPSDVWVRMGMQHSNAVDHLVIDDLCDQMRDKATCKDGAYRLSVQDAEKMFKYRGQGD